MSSHEPDRRSPDGPAATLLASVTSGLSVVCEPRAVRQRFEEELRTLVRARSIVVKHSAAAVRERPGVVTCDVPSSPWTVPVCLEAEFEPAQPVDDWQRRTLTVGAQLAALLLEIEQGGGRWSHVRKPDGAAPLIGSSPGIRRVRERIERVAPTDFTVLIEGGSGPDPHPSFIGVCGEAAVDYGDGEVEGAEVETEWMRACATTGRCPHRHHRTVNCTERPRPSDV